MHVFDFDVNLVKASFVISAIAHIIINTRFCSQFIIQLHTKGNFTDKSIADMNLHVIHCIIYV